ncbi:Core-2/I-branching beta-1-6-N-acetylglucosaminyltransferase family protein [Striga hermonthica]|uniref:Core-2/I-branching beta-1-6-N-acetylglucosaminyltransferase family protein n=1 Tax=Striga hermonthica TaxID=68872 RepID=A0A9N7RQ33_STRHE|nr:Core-2/I-branching beta-1-6-N-acetylglucosaminyltransferase family protein [Striga hermonthica]
MKTQHPLPAAGKPIAAPYPLIGLLSHAFLFVSGLTLGIVLCFHYKTFSFNLHVTNGQFSIFTSQPLADQHPPPPPMSEPNRTAAGGGAVTWTDFLEPPGVMHGMTDRELTWRASMAPKAAGFRPGRRAKVAFMFLTRGPVVLAPLWEMFFKGHRGLYSVYVHSDPNYNGSEPEGSVFHGRRIDSKEVKWGNVNMVEAERRQLAHALLDVSNERFVLLSESCIPLYNFSTVYSYLLGSNYTYVESYDLPGPVGRGRYNPNMAPTLLLTHWRKGSQWFTIDRHLALEVVSDSSYFSAFKSYCNGSCYADEHYLPTLVGGVLSGGFAERNANRTLTWVDWSRGGPHPAKFIRTSVNPGFLEWLRGGGGRRCVYNGRVTGRCYLFARKFTADALYRLIRFAPRVMHFSR